MTIKQRIKEALYFTKYELITKPWKVLRHFVHKDLTLVQKVNNPRFWFWIVVGFNILLAKEDLMIILHYISFKLSLPMLLLIPVTLLWKDWNAGYWRYEMKMEDRRQRTSPTKK